LRTQWQQRTASWSELRQPNGALVRSIRHGFQNIISRAPKTLWVLQHLGVRAPDYS
jgi:hypothetical protein